MNRVRSLLAVGAACFVGLLFLHAGATPKTGPATEKRFPPLRLPPGFKATLFACDPLIEYPSVISIGPRPGAIFVAIDYMTGLGSDGKVKSEIRLVEDTDGDGYADKATVFAKGFNSIQGLAYHDGTVYVMHAPFLTALRDTKKTGVADERKDLLGGLGLKPEDNSSRLHCANGVVIGHDGWLYLALGDNGVNVPRPEGDRLIHNGGGILRCRPDGRDLHVFSTGLRNIYDIALDAELNVFTRDNENDGGTYMIRVCHCFHGSDHGYPYDYYERPDHAMKPIGDFGLGSSAGGVCYLETQFPPEYRGNLFFGEWGKSVVRYELKRSGAGFAPVKEIDFGLGDPKDTYPFKPTDIVIQRDGTMMVSDYADGQRPKRGRGRIYHIAHVGKDAQKQPAAKTDLQKLNSESYLERCEGQAAFERTGQAGRDALGAAMRNSEVSPRGYGHALWAIAKLGREQSLDDMMINAKLGGPAPIRVQAIRAIADLTDPILVKHKLDAGRGDAKIAKFLAELPERQDPRLHLEIIIALGRLRWAEAPAWLRDNLGQPDGALAHAAMQTLRRADNWPAVLRLLDLSDDAPLRTIALRALTDQHDKVVVDGLLDRLANEKNSSRRREYADILARAYKKPGPWKYWGYRPGPRPANTEAWERTDAIAQSLEKVLIDPDPEVRLAILKRMQREKVPVPPLTLKDWLRTDYHAERAAAIITLLGEDPAPAARVALYQAALMKQHTVANRLTALDLNLKRSTDLRGELLTAAADLGKEEGPVLAEVLRRLGKVPTPVSATLFTKRLQSPRPEMRAAAIEALGDMNASEGHKPVLSLLRDEDVQVRRAAAAAAGKLGVKEAIEPLLKLASDPDLTIRLNCLESLRRLREPRVVPLAVAALGQPSLDLTALDCLSELGGPAQTSAVAELARRNPSADVLAASLRALTTWRDQDGLPAQKRQELDQAVADVHGTTGILLRWNASEPQTAEGTKQIPKQLANGGKTPAEWKTLFGAGTEARLVLVPKAAEKDAVWFAAADIVVSQPTPVEFLASSRGSLQVWLNGESLYTRQQPRSFQLDSDRFAGTLAKGTNRVLVQTGSSSGAVEFHLRFRRKSAKAAHEKLAQAALNRSGNAERGRKVFLDTNKSLCLKCHQLNKQGERIGPELTGVGSRFARIYLVESILEPSRTIAPSFDTLAVSLKNGKTLSGVKIAENETTLTLADNQGLRQTVAKADIDEQHLSAISTMPEGLEQRLTEDEFVDLIAFLMSQKGQRP